MNNSDRIEYIDIFRGCGIILMVMGHIWFGWYFDVFIHAFHMQMFFFLSGFFFKHMELSEVSLAVFAKKKAKKLLLPYIVFGIFFYIIELVFMGADLQPLLHLLWINTEGLSIAGALWFLTALFITEISYFLIDRYVCRNEIKWCIIIVISLFGNCVGDILPFELPYALGPAMVGVGLFHTGYIMRRHEKHRIMASLLNMKWYIWVFSAGAVTISIFVNGYVNMRSQEYSIIPLFWINAVAATLVGMNLARGICRICKKRIVGRWLTSIGENSIIYVCMNQFVLLLMNEYVMVSASSVLEKIIKKGVFFLGIFVVLYLCTLVIARTKLSKLIGREYIK